MNRCGRCKQDKAVEEFSPSQRKPGKWCRACMNEDYRSRRPVLPSKPCESCGAVIVEPRPGARFCSNRCKNAARIKADSARRAAIRATRTCGQCGISIAHMRANARWCSTSCAARAKRTPEKRRFHLLKYKYGMTPEDFDALLERQSGRCAICRTDTPGVKGWAVDHSHADGHVRGILCTPCNTGLGHFRDDVIRLQAAISYLA